MSAKKFTIREARRQDCQEIRRLAQELADFGKNTDPLEIDDKDLERDGFDLEHPLFFAYVAESDENPGVLVGYTLQYYVYATRKGKKMFLEDLYVAKSHRGTGLGFALIKKVVEKAVETGCNDMDFLVLDWNPAQKFYFSVGATDVSKTDGWRVFRITRASMDALLLK